MAINRKTTIDAWAAKTFQLAHLPRVKRGTIMLWLAGAPALLPVILMLHPVVTLNGNANHSAGNDVLGTGGILALFAMLLVTPLRTLTRRQWFVPLRRWYGIVFAFTILLDAILASNDTAFNGGPVSELASHSFLLIGTTMTLLTIPLCVMGIWNKWSMKQLGKYWKPIQQYGTYAIWGLLFVHLALLMGFGPIGDESPPENVLHQRLYQYLSCSLFLVVLRVPPVRRWVRSKPKRTEWKMWAILSPLIILFTVAYLFLINEFLYKGVAAASLNPISD